MLRFESLTGAVATQGGGTGPGRVRIGRAWCGGGNSSESRAGGGRHRPAGRGSHVRAGRGPAPEASGPVRSSRLVRACPSVLWFVEAIADLSSIARLPPGHDPGASYGVATAARQQWHLAIIHFGLFRCHQRTGERYVRTSERKLQTAPQGHGPPDHGDHGGHGRSRRSRPATAEGFGRAALANDTVARPIRVSERAIERPAPPGTRPRRRRLGGSRRGRGHGGHGKHCPSRPSRPPKAEGSSTGSRPRRHGDHCAQALPGLRPLWRCRCRSRRVTARTARHGGHGVHGGSRGFCRRRVRGDVLTYQGTGLRPAGEAPPYPSHPKA